MAGVWRIVLVSAVSICLQPIHSEGKNVIYSRVCLFICIWLDDFIESKTLIS